MNSPEQPQFKSDSPLPLFSVPWETPITPTVIVSERGHLFLGSDFYRTGDTLLFHEDPVLLFPNEQIHVVQGGVVGDGPSGWWHRALRIPSEVRDPRVVTTYFSGGQNALDLQKLVAGILGRSFASEDQTVRNVVQTSAGVHYHTDKGVIVCDYPHTVLEAGTKLKNGDVIGGGIRTHPHNSFTRWWGSSAVQEMINGSRILPIEKSAKIIRNDPTTAYAISSDVPDDANTTHIRFKLFEDREVDDSFWKTVWARETSSGVYLNSIVGLPSPDGVSPNYVQLKTDLEDTWALEARFNQEPSAINLNSLHPTLKKEILPLDVLMEAGVSDLLMILSVDYSLIGDKIIWLQRFLRRAYRLDRLSWLHIYNYPEPATESQLSSSSSFSFVGSVSDAAKFPEFSDSTVLTTASDFTTVGS
jgi:hypothetical protein